jgi:prepilin-type N-terminal cleavage/methylation domain-containing protein
MYINPHTLEGNEKGGGLRTLFFSFFFGEKDGIEKSSNSAFSLIELSIVLIIMGLLVAGITGGASLVHTAKLKGIIAEYQNYKLAYNTYYSRYGKLPGALATDPTKVHVTVNSWGELKNAMMIESTSITRVGSGNSTNYYIASKKIKDAFWGLSNSGDWDINAANCLILTAFTNSTQDAYMGILNKKDTLYLLDKLNDGRLDGGKAMVLWNGASISLGTPLDDSKKYGLVFKLDF